MDRNFVLAKSQKQYNPVRETRIPDRRIYIPFCGFESLLALEPRDRPKSANFG